MYIMMYLPNNSMYIVSCVMLTLCCDNGVQVLISKSVLLILMIRRLSCRYGTLLVRERFRAITTVILSGCHGELYMYESVYMCVLSFGVFNPPTLSSGYYVGV